MKQIQPIFQNEDIDKKKEAIYKSDSFWDYATTKIEDT